jgi:hypothetical protein
VLGISALGLLGVSNGWLLTAAIVSVVVLTVVILRMRAHAQRTAPEIAPTVVGVLST